MGLQVSCSIAPKFRRKEIYEKLKKDIGKILRELYSRKEVEIIEANACSDHIHMLVSIPPKMSVSGFRKDSVNRVRLDKLTKI